MLFRQIHKIVLLMACFYGAGVMANDVPNQQRQQELIYLLHQDCGSCHGMTLKGGLGPALLPLALAGKSAEYLYQVIAHGVPGKAMPPWENILQPGEIDFLVEQLLWPNKAAALTP